MAQERSAPLPVCQDHSGSASDTYRVSVVRDFFKLHPDHFLLKVLLGKPAHWWATSAVGGGVVCHHDDSTHRV